MKRIRSPEERKRFLKEDGFNGINYVFYLMIILTIWVTFACATFLDGARVAEQTCDINLHEIESGILAMNGQQDIIGYEATSNFKRVHIIPGLATSAEGNQVRTIGEYIEEEFAKRFILDGSKAKSGILKQTCGDSDVNLTRVVIYEPDIEINIVTGDGTNLGAYQASIYQHIIQAWQSGDMESIQQWIPGIDGFDYNPEITPTIELGNIKKWYVYTLNFDANNKYTGYSRSEASVANTPTLKRDPSFGLAGNTEKKAEGATIEMTMAITVHGVRQVFAESEAGRQTSMFGVIKPMYATNPQAKQYAITITQAADIVPAARDKRKR